MCHPNYCPWHEHSFTPNPRSDAWLVTVTVKSLSLRCDWVSSVHVRPSMVYGQEWWLICSAVTGRYGTLAKQVPQFSCTSDEDRNSTLRHVGFHGTKPDDVHIIRREQRQSHSKSLLLFVEWTCALKNYLFWCARGFDWLASPDEFTLVTKLFSKFSHFLHIYICFSIQNNEMSSDF